jgi:hypothetical protein
MWNPGERVLDLLNRIARGLEETMHRSALALALLALSTWGDPLAKWTFDDPKQPAIDSAAGGHDGTATSAAKWTEGVDGQAFLGDGRAARIEIPDSPAFDFRTGDFTVCAWVNPYRSRGAQQMVVGKNRYARNQREWGLLLEADGRYCFYVQRDGWKTVTSKVRAEAGVWTHLAAVVRGGEAELFVNGESTAKARTGNPEAHTDAPVSIGGIDNNGHLMQHWYGAIDDVELHDKARSKEEIATMQRSDLPKHEVPEMNMETYRIWDDELPPAEVDLPFVPGARFVTIKKREPEKDGFKWLHGVAVAPHQGTLFATWGENKGAENTVTEINRGSRSSDGGLTWSLPETIGPGSDEEGNSHGVFLSRDGVLWCFMARFGKGKGQFPGLCMDAYTLDDATNSWQHRGVVGQGIWPLKAPQRLDNGNWFVPGCDENWRAAVGISKGDDLTHWEAIKLPVNGLTHTEATVWIDGPEIVAILRNQSPQQEGPVRAAVCVSKDYGQTWTPSVESNFPMVTSKPFAGGLSTGQRFLVSNVCRGNSNSRSCLTIAVSRPGEKLLSRMWRLDAGQGLSYPDACEFDGKLYVAYSWTEASGGNQNSAKLAILPLASLQAE